jgi:hypothetical protein
MFLCGTVKTANYLLEFFSHIMLHITRKNYTCKITLETYFLLLSGIIFMLVICFCNHVIVKC